MKMANDKLKLKAIRARSYRTKTTLLGTPQDEGVFNIISFVANVGVFPNTPFNMASAMEVDFNAVVALWFY